MKIIDFLRSHAVHDERFERFNAFDSDRFDYTLWVRNLSGETFTLRNPAEDKAGTLSDKCYSIAAGSQLLAAGTAGWEWQTKKQHFVGIDIDTAVGHKNGLSDAQLEPVIEALGLIPWAEVRRSSGGQGLHVFVHFQIAVEVATRAESSALARAVITQMSRLASFDFKSVKDCAGGNMWIYKANAPATAYAVIKEASCQLDATDLPPGWREAPEAKLRKLDFAPSTVELSAEHLAIEKQISSLGTTIYIPEYGCWHIHTYALQQAHKSYNYRGHFETESPGSEVGKPNGYMFPLPGGGLLVKRFGGAREHESWFDGANGQYAYLNLDIPFSKALKHFAVNKTTQGYAFTCDKLRLMLKAIGVPLEIPGAFGPRALFLKSSRDECQIRVEKQDADGQVPEWTSTKDAWQRSFLIPRPSEAFAEADVVRISEIVRAVSTDTESAGWCIQTDGDWTGTKASEIANVLADHEMPPSSTMGRMRQHPYRLVFEPYQPEYLPGRRWNREAPQLACAPADEAGETPTWDAVYEHIGKGFNEDVASDEVCRDRGILSGAQYLKLWTKLLIEKPEQRTPYLFLTSRENNTGKTSLGASIRDLVDPGVAEINEEALVDKFTGELEGKVLCLIEELDLRDRRNKAYSTLKRVLTSKTLTIRKMRTDAYNVPNFTHFIHTANDANFVPCESEDMRIVMIHVPRIDTFIESAAFEDGIKREAPSMLRKLMDMSLPVPAGRFWLPVVQTSLKESVLAGDYDTEVSEAEEGLKDFAAKCLTKSSTSFVPIREVLTSYQQYCKAEKVPSVPDAGFLKTLREKVGMAVGKTQKRLNSKPRWCYTGISLNA